MMCKCCDGNNASCNCMHHKMHGVLGGVVLVVLGVLWLLDNYDVVSSDFWMWLLPVLVILLGLKCLVWCWGGKKNGHNE